MSRNDSLKELGGVYRRCLSSLNRTFKHPSPSPERLREFEKMVAAEAARENFKSSEERKKWIARKCSDLRNMESARLAKDPLAGLKAQIRAKMA